MKKTNLPSNNLFQGLTLIEILISVTIIMLLTLAAVPLFAGISDKQIMEQNAKKFVSDVRLARSKSQAGAIQNIGTETKKVWWGVNLGVCISGGEANEYSLGYIVLDDTVDPAVPDLGSGFQAQVTESLSPNLEFVVVDCTSPVAYPIYFERLTGNLYDNSGFYDDPINSISLEIIDKNSSQVRTVNISNGGNIEYDE